VICGSVDSRITSQQQSRTIPTAASACALAWRLLQVSTAYFYQERLRGEDPRRAAARRRIVIGLREVEKACR